MASSVRGKTAGICILCGKETTGAPAAEDGVLRMVRKVRSFLKIPMSPSAACPSCFPECDVRRARFEKSRKDYRIYAALFFLLVVFGSAAFGRLELFIFVPALLGALFILCLPYLSYFPKFEK